MRILVVTNMYPISDMPWAGVFVGDQVESLRSQGVEVDVFLVEGYKSRFNYPLGIPRLWKHLLKNKYDLIHAHYVFSGLISRAQWQCPVVLTHHGIEVLGGRQGWLSRRVTSWFDRVIVVSQQMKDKLGYPKAHIIPCGIDLDRFRPMPKQEARDALGFRPDQKLVLWAGHRRPEKRLDLVQAATSLMQEQDPSIELVLLTDKPHADVPKYMNACDVLLLVSDGEGSPMVVKEAMACNLPVVSTATGDVAQQIGEVPGCYICTQDPRDIAEKAILALRGGQRTRGREVVQHLSLESIARQIIDVYEGALGNRRARDRKMSQKSI